MVQFFIFILVSGIYCSILISYAFVSFRFVFFLLLLIFNDISQKKVSLTTYEGLFVLKRDLKT